jgi:hypothetical protein
VKVVDVPVGDSVSPRAVGAREVGVAVEEAMVGLRLGACEGHSDMVGELLGACVDGDMLEVVLCPATAERQWARGWERDVTRSS